MKLIIFVMCLMTISVVEIQARTEILVPSSINSSRIKKRFAQFGGFGNFGQSSALANANAYSSQFGPNGFGSSASNAAAQSFNANSPFGNFGASSSNSFSQGFNAGKGGFNGNSAFSGSQSYQLPGGKNLAVSYGAGFNVGPDGRPKISNSHGISFTK